MANKTTAELTAASTLDGTELVHVVQSSNSRKATSSAVALAVLGECRLVYNSTTEIQLNRHGGRFLFINGVNVAIPSTGPTLANTGLTAATRYYIYAYMSTGTMTLEASTTAYATDSTYGHQIKSADATRTLVGMVYARSGTPGTFAEMDVITYFNRRRRQVVTSFSTDRAFTNTSLAEVNSEIAQSFSCWGDDPPQVSLSGSASFTGTAGNANATIELFRDGAVTLGRTAETVGGDWILRTVMTPGGDDGDWTETGHTVTLRARINTATLTFPSTDSVGAGKTRLTVSIRS